MKPSSKTLRTRKPSEVTDDFWVSAWRHGDSYPAHTVWGGKWLVFMPKADLDEADVWRVREALRRLGFTQPLGWKSDQATRAGLYKVRSHKDVNRYQE